MRRVPTIAVVLLGISVAGCRNAGNHELLERELRLQEDKISQLESELEQARAQIQERCRDTGVIVPDTGYERPFTIAPSRGRNAPSAGPSRTTSPPEVTLPSGEAAPPYQGPPVIQPPDPKVPEGHLPGRVVPEPTAPDAAPLEPTARPANLPGPRSARKSAEEVAPPPGFATGPGEVNEITINHGLTGRRTAGGTSSEETIAVAIEPRAAGGQLVKAAGAISIVVLDLSKEGPEARIARWDFAADQTAQYYRDARHGGGMVFNLRWPTAPPQHGSLQLFVRLTTPDGRKLVADTELTALGAKPAARETGQLGDPPNSAIRLVSDAESLPQTNWRRSRTPMPRSEALPTRTEISLTRAEPPAPAAGPAPPTAEFSRKPGEPRRLPDDVLDGTAAAPIDSAAPPRDERAWAPYR